MKDYVLTSNVVDEREFRIVTEATLDKLAEYLEGSFGPFGTNSAINENNINNKYSKDGRTILESIKFNGIIEETIRHEVKEVTRNVDLKVGDGTTSAVIMSSILYKKLIEYKSSTKYTPYTIIRKLNEINKIIADKIRENKKEFNYEVARKISMISTNGDEYISDMISDLYKKYGNNVHIDVKRSNDENTKIKVCDGLVLDNGYSDPSLINTTDNKVIIRNANIYLFQNNIDTPEMVDFMRTIIYKNIFEPLNEMVNGNTSKEVKPTVIIAPTISKDQSPYLEQLLSSINAASIDAKPPLLIITTNRSKDRVYDIGKVCGCKTIQKYIDPEQQEQDIEAGLAPTLETVVNFAGKADEVIADASSTTFVNPAMMYKDEAKTIPSDTYTGLINFLKSEIEEAKRNNEPVTRIGRLKTRLYSLEANLIELYIGGVSSTDREYYQDLVEDAVKNCRSAAQNGAGFGANIEGYLASESILLNTLDNEDDAELARVVYSSYVDLLNRVYRNSANPKEIVKGILKERRPVNIVTGEYDDNVLCSIETDVEILNSVIKIMSVLFTSNQFIGNSTAIVSPYMGLETCSK